ncbi:hypothetical protein ANCDUO_17274 [Ancylostoma duodenale]|uniref:Uncharacterized protein n=1 Tax=Ancylostoma duodenale TaxID=51022 RepID=A0A0C2C8E7_9BILA|nr:hypothetical protein ANCDUO_17274 [Ancylostoma duodenale]
MCTISTSDSVIPGHEQNHRLPSAIYWTQRSHARRRTRPIRRTY